MYQADLTHPNTDLQRKLEHLYTLNKGKSIELSFRPSYLNLLKALGDPHLHLPPVIHVAGTNGKGSVVALLRSVFEHAGYRVHAYTSPHLLRFNERIVLAGKPIADKDLNDLIDEVTDAAGGAPLTFFEITTAMAFQAFTRVQADVVLLEVGLGGRLDCTNVIQKPAVSIINRISYDHTEHLGGTLPEISNEKSGIIKNETPCIVGYQGPDFASSGAMNILRDKAAAHNAPLYCAGEDWRVIGRKDCFEFEWQGKLTGEPTGAFPHPNLEGAHQILNAGAALAALKVLEDSLPVPVAALRKGLRNIHWPGRMQRIQGGPLAGIIPSQCQFWYDGGHNDSAGEAIADVLKHWSEDTKERKPVHLIVGMKADKDPCAFLTPILPYCGSITLVPLTGVGRYIMPGDIQNLMDRADGPPLYEAPSIRDAIVALSRIEDLSQSSRILVCGSLYLAGQVLEAA